MPFQEDFSEFLDEEQGFASCCTITPAFGRPYRVKGIFSNEYMEVDSGMVGLSSSNPIFECATKDLNQVEYGDLLQIYNSSGTTDYRIVTTKPDGTGWIRLELEKQNQAQ